MNARKLLSTCHFHLGKLSGTIRMFATLMWPMITQVHVFVTLTTSPMQFIACNFDSLKENNSCANLQNFFWQFLFTFVFWKHYNTCAVFFVIFSNFRNSLITWRSFGTMKAWRRASRGPMNTSWLTAHNSKSASEQGLGCLKLPVHPQLAALLGSVRSLQCEEQSINMLLQKSAFKMAYIW